MNSFGNYAIYKDYIKKYSECAEADSITVTPLGVAEILHWSRIQASKRMGPGPNGQPQYHRDATGGGGRVVLGHLF